MKSLVKIMFDALVHEDLSNVLFKYTARTLMSDWTVTIPSCMVRDMENLDTLCIFQR